MPVFAFGCAIGEAALIVSADDLKVAAHSPRCSPAVAHVIVRHGVGRLVGAAVAARAVAARAVQARWAAAHHAELAADPHALQDRGGAAVEVERVIVQASRVDDADLLAVLGLAALKVFGTGKGIP